MFNEKVLVLKKVFSIIVFLLCVLTAGATSTSSYRGFGYGSAGYVPSSAYRPASIGRTSAPVTAMRSTSTMGGTRSSRGASYSGASYSAPASQIRGVYSAASAARGGVSTYNPGGHKGGPRKSKMEETPPDPSVPTFEPPECGCYWYWDEEEQCWKCTNCSCIWDIDSEDDDECGCVDHCQCPICDGWQVWLFMALLAAGYGYFVRRRRVKSE